MIKKETVLHYAGNDEEKFFLSEIYDNYRKSSFNNYNTFSDFLSFDKRMLIDRAFSSEKDLPYNFFGGYDDAERTVLGFIPCEYDVNYPLSCIEVKGKYIENLSHRDFLGALMSLGIERNLIGDIVVGNPAYIFVISNIAEYICLNLSNIGKYGCILEIKDDYKIEKENREEIITTSVSSLRLDLIVSSGFKIKRSVASELICDGRVVVSGSVIKNPSHKITDGSSITSKGFGKIIYKGEYGTSKKGKIFIKIKKLL